MLSAIALSKQFSGRKVIAALSFAWYDPGIYLIAGANGSGKSTLLSMLAGALSADSGGIFLSGSSLKSHPDQFRRNLSYCPADCLIFPFLTGKDWLAFVASVRGDCDRAASSRLLEAFDLDPYPDCRFDQMSLTLLLPLYAHDNPSRLLPKLSIAVTFLLAAWSVIQT